MTDRNALRGLISGMVGRHEQGCVSGATQSLQSLGWVVGPLVGGFVTPLELVEVP
ncbi:MFS transporter [Tengunoibacter tsumagoiensis]|uniref:MFS transporter n=1 Tax=Tengunoibacter tsumagoiensis TaxID=2014871 RepID=UPI0010A9667B|nr:MFS transporter [Tengunoibacter tsumagoiensis]